MATKILNKDEIRKYKYKKTKNKKILLKSCNISKIFFINLVFITVSDTTNLLGFFFDYAHRSIL